MRFKKDGKILNSPEVQRNLVFPEEYQTPELEKMKESKPWYEYEEREKQTEVYKIEPKTKSIPPVSTQEPETQETEVKKISILSKISAKWKIIKNSKIYALIIILTLLWTVVYSYFVLINAKATRDGLQGTETAFSQIQDNWKSSALSNIYFFNARQKTQGSLLSIKYSFEYSNQGKNWGWIGDDATTDCAIAQIYGDYTQYNFYDNSKLYDASNGCPNGYVKCGGINQDYITCLPQGSHCPINQILTMRINYVNFTNTDNVTNAIYVCPLNASCSFIKPSANFIIENVTYKPTSSYIQVDYENNTYFVIFISNLGGWWLTINTSSNAALVYPYRKWAEGTYATVMFWSYNHDDYPIAEFAVNEYKMCNDKNAENVTPNRRYFLIGNMSYGNTKQVTSPCATSSTNYSWIPLHGTSELGYAINNGIFYSGNSFPSYCPCTDYPYFLFYRRYLTLSKDCRFFMSETSNFASKLQLIFDFVQGIVILIYINWGMSGIALIIKVVFFIQKHYFNKSEKRKNIIATAEETKTIEGMLDKIEALYGICNSCIQLAFKLGCYLIIARSTFTTDFKSHKECFIDPYIVDNVNQLDSNFAEVLTNIYINLSFGAVNFLLAVISFGSCCIDLKNDVKKLSKEDMKKGLQITLARIL